MSTPEAPKPLDPHVAADELNAVAAKQGLNLKFEAGKDGVEAKISADTYKGLIAPENPHIGDLTGSNKFQLGTAESTAGKAAGALGGRFGIKIGGPGALMENHSITAKGLTEEDIKAFEHNAAAIKPAVDKKPDFTAAKAEHDAIVKADAAHADPKLSAVAEKLNFKGSAVNFKPENGANVAHLDAAAAANLEAVLKSGVKPAELFGSDKITYDAKTKTITAAADITDKDVTAFVAEGKAVNVAVRMGDPDIVKGLIKPTAQAEVTGHGLDGVIAKAVTHDRSVAG